VSQPGFSSRATVVSALLALLAAPAFAQSTPDPGAAGPAPAAQDPSQKPWWERLTIYGDFRARYEGFFQDTEPRHRQRFRFRIGVKTSVAEGLDFNVRLASGERIDVTSTNQDLDEFLNRKPINIDQASLAYTPSAFKKLTLGVGKYGYPVTRTQLVWDDDVNWEGTYQALTLPISTMTLRLVGVQSPIDEVGADEDAFMFGQFAQAAFRLGPHALQVSVADYAFRHADRIAVALDEQRVIRAQNTNRLRREGGRVVGFASGFNLVDAIAQLTLSTSRADYPITALGEYVVNTRAADGEDSGLWLAAQIGKAAKPKTFAAGYTFARVERDAVVSAFNFSDMGPATNVIMSMATFSYAPRSRVSLDATAILTKLLDPPANARNPLLRRIQVDARVSF
jgi:hypothetical protein